MKIVMSVKILPNISNEPNIEKPTTDKGST